MTSPKKEADHRLNPLTDEMVRVFEAAHGTKYNHQGVRDAMALKGLLAKYSPELILEVWAKGVTAAKEFDRTSTFAQLNGKWNQLQMGAPKNPAVYKEPPPNTSDKPEDSPFGPCVKCGKASWMRIHDERGNFNPLCSSKCEADLRQVTP